ncbi:MAG TPA: glycosyltransferase family 2 protein [Acidimicrobiales bacterium]|nr:glycosyltransferase family 2 protein [Acidimicrobiales bacterium]
MALSVLMPAYNERDNLEELIPETLAMLDSIPGQTELVVVDDGSTDGTDAFMAQIHDPRVRHVRLRRNAGKSAALSAGLARVAGDIVVLMDADGQDDPNEVPRLVKLLEERNLDLITGSRAENRHDRFIKRNTSKIYNRTTALVSGVDLRDFNSGFKVMRNDLATSLEMYGELHRYIPVLAHWSGFSVGEEPIAHHERRHGETKFGRARFWRGFLDLITVKFLTTYTARPFHLFGSAGIIMGLLGTALLVWMGVIWLAGDRVGSRPALLIGVFLVVIAIQMISMGLIAELVVNMRRRRNLDATIAEEDV